MLLSQTLRVIQMWVSSEILLVPGRADRTRSPLSHGRNLSVRVDRSAEDVGRRTTPDASNYTRVSVRGPPSSALSVRKQERGAGRARQDAAESAGASPPS
ncbi:Hypothetical predicted protein [Xyrichtys novacula]|uniref:Uncharacterized protein n=1 Tax=Xyrichtys novacula TaxID=13765 RepID=A0AAV1FRB8_XYRNO|nr:Hypothetical predicted protein [Xyrichtys novacula]